MNMQFIDQSVIAQGARFINILPEIEDFLSKIEEAQERKVFAALDKGELTPQAALNAWIEKRLMRQLYSRFAQRVKIAQTVGQEHQHDMESST